MKISRINIFLLLILIFSFITRITWLSEPANEYFDEVYHAFTARRMLHADPKAWEWWNPHPEGFAYEWTHPPLAKEMMVLGMLVFGENSFGWRIPGALLGVGCVFLVFLLTKRLFRDEKTGLLAAAIFALEGLPLVMSRIGMNDVYLLFFALLTIYFFWKEEDFLSSLALGLAFSAKWSAAWLLPVLLVSFFVFKRKISASCLWFLVIPPLVYVASYIPMFLTGHGFDIFIGVQKQMWWYHTSLKATHPFTSPWWSWPILMRPIWLFTNSPRSGFVSNIYAMGNPIIFWSGLVAILLSGVFSFIKRNKKLGLVVFSYFVFFVPWAVSPRIMFLYHYLPSLPFLAISLGYVLKKYPRVVLPFIVVSSLVFLYFYPHWTGIEIPISLNESYYWFSSWH
jgi:dolichyl-phosphate-mannose-protein mannosyltransferase